MKIRYYGLFSNSTRKESMVRCRELLGVETLEEDGGASLEVYEDWQELCEHIIGHDLFICPQCKKGHLILMDDYRGRSP
jgi:hypothetical protein